MEFEIVGFDVIGAHAFRRSGFGERILPGRFHERRDEFGPIWKRAGKKLPVGHPAVRRRNAWGGALALTGRGTNVTLLPPAGSGVAQRSIAITAICMGMGTFD